MFSLNKNNLIKMLGYKKTSPYNLYDCSSNTLAPPIDYGSGTPYMMTYGEADGHL